MITIIPVYNSDGNDRIARTNRVSQNGPDGGVGERPNAMGLDLNRDGWTDPRVATHRCIA